MNRWVWWILALAFLGACSSSPSSSTAPLGTTPSPTPVFGVYKPIPDLCSAVDYEGDPVADHSDKSNYALYTCDRGGANVSALFFTSTSDAALHFKGVQANVTGAKPVANLGTEAFSAGTSVWVYDANLVLMVRVKSGGSADVAADLARKSLPRLRS
jgi:hypothetical protein